MLSQKEVGYIGNWQDGVSCKTAVSTENRFSPHATRGPDSNEELGQRTVKIHGAAE